MPSKNTPRRAPLPPPPISGKRLSEREKDQMLLTSTDAMGGGGGGKRKVSESEWLAGSIWGRDRRGAIVMATA